LTPHFARRETSPDIGAPFSARLVIILRSIWTREDASTSCNEGSSALRVRAIAASIVPAIFAAQVVSVEILRAPFLRICTEEQIKEQVASREQCGTVAG
jgi:hypothetical protein